MKSSFPVYYEWRFTFVLDIYESSEWVEHNQEVYNSDTDAVVKHLLPDRSEYWISF